jgi:putative transposase
MRGCSPGWLSGITPCTYIVGGGAAKSINQFYNKRIAEIVSRETKGTTEKFKPTEEYYDLTNRRNNRIHDLMKKTGKQLIEWCAENRADTIVLGCNRYWKQESHIGHVNNQKFVQIPFSYLKNVIAWLAEREGIRVVEQEESYTSKASFLDRDFIPVYGQEPEVFRFSGKRNPRGLYTSEEGIVTNADLQASANILRKAYPNAFIEGNEPEFRTIKVIRHPEYEQVRLNRMKQKATC